MLDSPIAREIDRQLVSQQVLREPVAGLAVAFDRVVDSVASQFSSRPGDTLSQRKQIDDRSAL